jgi:hypothetical protein
MLLISSRLHGIWDYVVAALLVASPWLFGFADNTIITWLPVAIGCAIFGLSLITDYEYSLAKIVPLRGHLIADMGAAVLLAASPWIFNFDEIIYAPHLIMGLTELVVAAMTQRVPYGSTKVVTPKAGVKNLKHSV